MMAAMKKNAKKIAKQNYYSEKREKERDSTINTGRSYRIATVLQVLNQLFQELKML